MKRLLLVLIGALVLAPSPLTPAASANSAISQVKIVEENLGAIELELKKLGVDVISVLDEMQAEYEQLAQGGVTRSQSEAIAEIVSTLEQLKADYSAFKAGESGYATRGVAHPVYSPAVAAVIAWFVTAKYTLAAELLTHAVSNNSPGSNYKPYNGSRVASSPVWGKIRAGSATSGSSTFTLTGSVVQKDLHYAINKFKWTKSGSKISLRDLYDFAPGDYNGIAGIAVNTMYLAQQAGVIVPFYTRITA